MKTYTIYLLSVLFSISITAQIDFIDASSLLPQNGTFYSWMQKGACDMNNDRLDDIVRSTTTGNFYLLTQQKMPGLPFIETYLGKFLPASPLSIICGDVNNDDFRDILTGGDNTGVKLLLSNQGVNVTTVHLPGSDTIFTQASAMADINGDGFLDLFVCHDDAKSGIWRNDGFGGFIKDDMGINLHTVPTSDNSGNYGVVFTDFDNDGDLDFYISKCRAGVNDPNDPRRINQLYVNNGNNQYSEAAAEYNMKDNNQSWVTEFQDIDNDGDLDALILNHYTPSRLMRNNGSGYFTEITSGSGLESLPNGILQAMMADFDNDGYVDVLVCGMTGAYLYKNNGNSTFTSISHPILEPVAGKTLRSFCAGDFNADGFLDLYTSYYFGSVAADRLWLNAGNSNHFISVNLFGYESNRNAVGARIKVEAGGKTYIREIRSGESYGISHAHCQNIGIGTNASISKLTVSWPDGKTNEFNNISIDKPINITEGRN